MKAGKPVAKLVPVSRHPKKRCCSAKVNSSPDDFNDPLLKGKWEMKAILDAHAFL